jgi:hypothetical protein
MKAVGPRALRTRRERVVAVPVVLAPPFFGLVQLAVAVRLAGDLGKAGGLAEAELVVGVEPLRRGRRECGSDLLQKRGDVASVLDAGGARVDGVDAEAAVGEVDRLRIGAGTRR